MSRVFAYCRVSTLDQTTQNQRLEIKAAGFAIEARRLIEETVSGSVAAKQRPGFMRLIDRLEPAILNMAKNPFLWGNATIGMTRFFWYTASAGQIHLFNV